MKATFLKRGILSTLMLFAGLCSFNSLQAQRRFNEEMMSDLNGKAIFIKFEYVQEGTPYFPEEYTKSAITLHNGRTYSISSRMNLHENALIMREDGGTEFLLGGNVSKVTFDFVPVDGKPRTVVFQRGFPSIDNFDSTTYYEVLDSGKLKLIKRYKVTFVDKRGYGEASFTRVFTTSEFYYIILPGNIIKPLGKGKKDFLAALPDKKTELEKYIDSKKIKWKKQEEWIDLVAYYNNLYK